MSIIPSLAILGLLFFIFTSSMGAMGSRGGGMGGAGGLFGVGKSKAKLITAEMKTDMNFSKVAGLEEAKVEVMEFVEFLKNPKRFTDLGAKIPRVRSSSLIPLTKHLPHHQPLPLSSLNFIAHLTPSGRSPGWSPRHW